MNKEADMWEILMRGMMGEDPSDIIPEQEARGQRIFVNSCSLPKRDNRSGTHARLAEMGVIFGNDIDDLFVEAQLPEGWKKEPTEHSMWSKLLDDSDKEVAMIFYKAAFYDRDAFISITNEDNTRNTSTTTKE